MWPESSPEETHVGHPPKCKTSSSKTAEDVEDQDRLQNYFRSELSRELKQLDEILDGKGKGDMVGTVSTMLMRSGDQREGR